MNYADIDSKINLLAEIEKNHDVARWNHNGIDYWPILKNTIYFNSRKLSAISLLESPQATINKLILKVRNKLRPIQNVLEFLPGNDDCDLFFVGANVYRNVIDNLSQNKYFDPMMDNCGDYKSILTEYSPLVSPPYKPERVRDAFFDFKKNKGKIEIVFTPGLKRNILLVCKTAKIEPVRLTNQFLKTIQNITLWYQFWKGILAKSKPKAIFVLCYYNVPMYGLTLAAKELGIPSVDMQHGGQGRMHPAYSFQNFPSQSFNTLPDYFWLWDKESENFIESWAKYSSIKTILGGNPWISFLREDKAEDSTTNLKKIVCTLTIGLPKILPDFMVEAIKNSPVDYVWYLRFHPRTAQIQKNELGKIINRDKIAHKVNLEDANSLPLPQLFSGAWAHISHSSGSIAEAALMGLQRNVITDEIGHHNFAGLVSTKKAHYFNPAINTELVDFLNKLEVHDSVDTTKYDYKKIIDEIIK